MFNKIKDKINEKDVGLAKDYFTMLINSCGYENHCHDDYVNTLDEKYLKEWREARIIRSDLMDVCFKLFNVEPKDESWCFVPDTKIILKGELKNIQDIKIGDEVLTHKKRFKKVTKLYERKINEEIIKIKTNYTNIPLEVTKNHLFYVAENLRTPQKDLWRKNYKKPNFVWKKAEELTRNDFIYMPRYNYIKDVNEFFVEYKNKKQFVDNINLNIDNNFMRLIGLYLSEGHHSEGFIKKNKYPYGYIGFSFGLKSEDLANFVYETMGNYFNNYLKPTYRKSTIEFGYGKRIIRKFFNQFGNFAHNKKIPSWVINLTEDKLKFLIKGMFEGDGSINQFSFQYSTTSREMAYQLKLILNKLGIICNLSNRGKSKDSYIDGRKIISKHEVYSILISGDSARKLKEFIGVEYDGGKKTSGQFGYVGEDYFLTPVLGIEKVNYFGKVYNFGVEEDESYCTFNGIAHNCKMKHISIVAMGCQENAVRLIEDGLIDEIQKLAKQERECYLIFLNLLEINENNAKVISSA